MLVTSYDCTVDCCWAAGDVGGDMLWIIEYVDWGESGGWVRLDVVDWGWADDTSVFMLLYGWLEFRRTVYTLSTEERRSKNGIR